jgi:anhydro-N-acetylmuramic acid kinase
MRVLGINTGTSVDGVDLALIDWDINDFKAFKIIKQKSYDFNPEIKKNIRKIISLQQGSLEEISNLNFAFSRFLAALINEFKQELSPEKSIELTGMHGQTIFHGAESTWQIGDGSIVANLTMIPCISDFRPADMAAGGGGAPLTSFLDDKIIKDEKETVGTLNIGGIANISIMEPGKDTIAYDTGPGNALIDLLMQKLFKRDFDENGKVAAIGKVNESFVHNLVKRTPYFGQNPPKTTGKELFNDKYAEKLLDLGNKENIISAATYLTSYTISQELWKFKLAKVYIAGGGTKNQVIMQQIREMNPEIQFLRHDQFNIDSQYKEAILFSLLAFTCFHKIPNNVPCATGAKKATILGKIAFI